MTTPNRMKDDSAWLESLPEDERTAMEELGSLMREMMDSGEVARDLAKTFNLGTPVYFVKD